jgi:transcriptional regulator with XRE-family HTH domain
MKILLDELMNKKNLTIRQVSILTGVPKSTVSDIVSRGRIPWLDTMEQLAKGLKVRITDLFESDYK